MIGELSADEWRDNAAGHERFAQRISRERQADFRAVLLLRMEGGKPAAAGASFQEFCRTSVPPQPLYSCPQCGGEGAIVSRQRVADFANGGGTVLAMGELTLASA
ncbi:MAG: hypothetical protein AB7Q17_06090 [Phycisphaerae bacterium]